MLPWHGAFAELVGVFTHVGAFRDVRSWRLHVDGDDVSLADRFGRRWAPGTFRTTDRRRVVIIVTDAVAEHWYRAAIWQHIADWGGTGMVALIDPLPLKLWNFSGIGPNRVRAHATSRRRRERRALLQHPPALAAYRALGRRRRAGPRHGAVACRTGSVVGDGGFRLPGRERRPARRVRRAGRRGRAAAAQHGRPGGPHELPPYGLAGSSPAGRARGDIGFHHSRGAASHPGGASTRV